MELLCMMKEIHKAMNVFEDNLVNSYNICLNEAMVLCSLAEKDLSASEISEKTGLTNSHTSKVIRSIENKELIKRELGEKDKRQMYFTLSQTGNKTLKRIKSTDLKIPDIFQPILKNCSK